ncbi:hypothetical protein ACFWR9_41840 [Streptomyces sp. NPDC058534]|uniref:hypothetical protein n=1 Tax=Streptomyces sp. NPDC058534 TaxID=3346541 RepID=UPI003660E1AE
MTDRIRIVQIPVPRTTDTAPRAQPMPPRWHWALTTVLWQALVAMGGAWVPVPIDDHPQDSGRSDAP